MATTHHFAGTLSWRAGGSGVETGNHSMTFEGRPPLELSGAPGYRGDPSRLSPEDLFVGALASCQMLSFLAFAARAGITVLAYEDRTIGTLAMADKKMRMTEVVLRPRITVAPGSDLEKVRQLVDSGHEACFIANSVSSTVTVEPDIVTGA
jgi:organic hydroperoxide reductase OsmC/OhrA